MVVKNEDARPSAYSEVAEKFRPSHADYTYFAKYGLWNWQGGGRSSARETIGRVAAGAIAKKILRMRYNIQILAYVKQVHKIKAKIDINKISTEIIESNPVRCPDSEAAKRMIKLIERVRSEAIAWEA
jgi:chorismate synthase